MTLPPASKPIIGLAGGIGAGKSLVARQLAQLGCGVIDSDELSRQAMQMPQVKAQIVRVWGDRLLDAQGQIDRKAIAAEVFENPDQLRKLEQIIHPVVHQARKDQRQTLMANPTVLAIVEDCPLLFETGLDVQVDVIIFVASDPRTRLSRLVADRGWSESDVAARQKNQWELDSKAQHADYIVNNCGSEKKCFDQVRSVLSRILQQKKIDPLL